MVVMRATRPAVMSRMSSPTKTHASGVMPASAQASNIGLAWGLARGDESPLTMQAARRA